MNDKLSEILPAVEDEDLYRPKPNPKPLFSINL